MAQVGSATPAPAGLGGAGKVDQGLSQRGLTIDWLSG